MSGTSRLGYPVASASAAFLCLLLSIIPEQLAAMLAFDRQAILDGQFWRLWSGHLEHFATSHALLDGAVLLLVGAVAEREWGTRKTSWILFMGATAISCGLLLLVPQMAYYRGASGLSILLAVAGGRSLWQSRPTLRPWLALCGGFLLVKIALESMGHAADLARLPDAVRVAWQAHVLGSIFGWFVCGAWRSGQAVMMQPSLADGHRTGGAT